MDTAKIEQLERLSALLSRGILTQEEFDKAKFSLLHHPGHNDTPTTLPTTPQTTITQELRAETIPEGAPQVLEENVVSKTIPAQEPQQSTATSDTATAQASDAQKDTDVDSKEKKQEKINHSQISIIEEGKWQNLLQNKRGIVYVLSVIAVFVIGFILHRSIMDHEVSLAKLTMYDQMRFSEEYTLGEAFKRELSFPTRHLDITDNEYHNPLLGSDYITVVIVNKARYASYSDIEIHVEWLNERDNRIATEPISTGQSIFPGRTVQENIEVKRPYNASKYRVSIVKARALGSAY